jgi:hypothetical protein
MQEGISHRLIGYDRLSGVAVVEHPIPPTHLAFAKALAEVGPDDPLVTRCYPLTRGDARNVAETIGAILHADGLNFFLEGATEPRGGRTKPLIYVSYGMWKSGSTLAFELTRAILEQNGYLQKPLSRSAVSIDGQINFVPELHAPQLEAVELEARALGYPVALKTHASPTADAKAWAAEGRIVGHCVYRDLREIALSLMDHGARSRAEGEASFAYVYDLDHAILCLYDQVPRFLDWVRLPGFMSLFYDEVAFDTRSVVDRLCKQLLLEADPAEVERIAKTERFTQFNKGVPERYRAMDTENSERILGEFKRFHEDYIELSRRREMSVPP